jgi:hypothetical protein
MSFFIEWISNHKPPLFVFSSGKGPTLFLLEDGSLILTNDVESDQGWFKDKSEIIKAAKKMKAREK